MKIKNPTSILNKTKKIKRNLLKQKQLLGFIDDSSGMRYMIPAMLMEIMELTEGKRYYTWFKKEFPDDIGEPYMYLQWLLLFYYRKEYKIAFIILKEIIHQNIHLIPLVLNQPLKHIDGFWYSSNYEDEDYISKAEIDKMNYINADFKEWLNKNYGKKEYQEIVTKYIELRKELNETHELIKRQEILQKEQKLFE
jgi:hypothetical protein